VTESLAPILSVSCEGNVHHGAQWVETAKKLVKRAYDLVEPDTLIAKRFETHIDHLTSIKYQVFPGDPPIIKIVVDTKFPPEPEYKSVPSYIPAVNNPELILSGGECGAPFGRPGERMFTERIGYDVKSGSGAAWQEDFITTKASIDSQEAMQCNDEFEGVSGYCLANAYEKHTLDLPFPFKFAGKTFSKVWASGGNISFSGPAMFDPTIWFQGSIMDVDGCKSPVEPGWFEYFRSEGPHTHGSDIEYMVCSNGFMADHCSEKHTSQVWGTHGTFRRDNDGGWAGGVAGTGGVGIGNQELQGLDFDEVSDRESELNIEESGRYNTVEQSEITKLSEDVLGMTNYLGRAFGMGGGTETGGSGYREFFAISLHDYEWCAAAVGFDPSNPNSAFEATAWYPEDDPLSAAEIVLVPATDRCPAMVGIFMTGKDAGYDGYDERTWRSGGPGYLLSAYGANGDPGIPSWHGQWPPSNPSESYYPFDEGTLKSHNCNELNKFGYNAFLSGADHKGLAWTHCGATNDGDLNALYNLHSRTFWFILDEEGFPYDCLQQVSFNNVDGDNYEEQVYGDVEIDSPRVGRITV
jgi:hypothetical protein